MSKGLRTLLAVAVLVAGAMTFVGQSQANHGHDNYPPDGTPPTNLGPAIYVTGQDTTYSTIVLASHLPNEGDFQLLEMGGPTGLFTEFGPGDVGYLGGRWWIDVNGDSEMDDDDVYFMCPLLGPGY